MKPAKILFFVKGSAPTPEDFAEATELSANVVFRNAQYVPAEGSLEECDGVAGCVPAPYAKLPTAAEAIKARKAKLKALTEKAADDAAKVPAPVALPPVDGQAPAAPDQAPEGDADAPKADAAAPMEANPAITPAPADKPAKGADKPAAEWKPNK